MNPQGMDFNGWLSVHFEKGSDATENMQRNDIRVLESKEKAHKRLWKWRDDNGVMHPDEIPRCSGWTRRSCQLLNTGVMTTRQEVASRGKDTLGCKS